MLKLWIPFPFLSSFFFLGCGGSGGGSFFTFLFAAAWGGFSFVSAGWFSFSSSMSLWWISAATWLYKSNTSVSAPFMKDDNYVDESSPNVTETFYWNNHAMYWVFTEHTSMFHLNGNQSLSRDVASWGPLWGSHSLSQALPAMSLSVSSLLPPNLESSIVIPALLSQSQTCGLNAHYSSKLFNL